MSDYYATLRLIHISAVGVSGSLFVLRGLVLNVFGMKWAMTAWLRYVSYAIDTMLLVAAILLAINIQQYPFVDAWLTTKVLLLVIYIVLGSFALKRGRTRTARIIFWLSAILVFLYIITVARAHDPLGWLANH